MLRSSTYASEAAANSAFAGFALWDDVDESGTFDPQTDQLIGQASSFTLDANGEADLVLPNFSVGIDSAFRDFLLVTETTAVSDQQGLDSFRVTLRSGLSRMEDAFYGTTLVLPLA